MLNTILYILYKLSPVLFFGGVLVAIIGAENIPIAIGSFAVMTFGYILWSVTEKILLRRLENEKR